MSKTKGGGSTRNGRDSNAQRLGVKVFDGTTVTSDAAALAGVTVSGEVVAQTKGPKLNIMSYKNKTGYKRRMGHRQQLTQVRVTAIEKG